MEDFLAELAWAGKFALYVLLATALVIGGLTGFVAGMFWGVPL